MFILTPQILCASLPLSSDLSLLSRFLSGRVLVFLFFLVNEISKRHQKRMVGFL